MKKRILSCISMLIWSVTYLLAQSIQQGIVMEYNGEKQKTPLSNVSISVKNAARCISDQEGRFKLDFRTLHPGDKVEVRTIEKEGYVVFNQDAVDEWRVAKEESTFVIILCKDNRFKALKDKYYTIASESYARQKEAEEKYIADLLKKGKMQEEEYQQQLKAISDQYLDQLDNLDNYIDRFARIDLSELDQEERSIIEMVQHGQIDEAIKAYDSMGIMEKMDMVNRQSSEASNAIQALQKKVDEAEAQKIKLYAMVKNQIALLKLKGGRESFQRIEQMQEEVASKLTQYPDVVMDCIDFYTDQSNSEKTIYWCEIYLKFDSISLDQRVFVESCLSAALFNNGDAEAAIMHNQRSLDLMPESVAVKSSRSFYRYLNALILQGGLLWGVNRPEESIRYVSRVVTLCDSVYALDPSADVIKQYKSVAQFRWLVALCGCDKYQEALDLGLQVLDFMKEEAVSENEFWMNRYGKMLNQVFNICIYLQKEEDHMQLMSQSLEIWKKLYDKNPQAYVSDYADVWRRHLHYSYKHQEYTKCLEYIEQEIALRQEACQNSGDIDKEFLALALRNYGHFNAYLGNAEKADKYLKEAIEIQQSLADKHYDTHVVFLTQYQIDILQFAMDQNDIELGKTFADKLQRNLQYLFDNKLKENPNTIEYGSGVLGVWHLKQGNRDAATPLYNRILKMNEKCREDEDLIKLIDLYEGKTLPAGQPKIYLL